MTGFEGKTCKNSAKWRVKPFPARIFIDNRAKKVDNSISMDVLSMGMTHDYPEALQCGATIVRIGEGIFGKRIYNTNSEE